MMAITAMTTSSSISVKAVWRCRRMIPVLPRSCGSVALFSARRLLPCKWHECLVAHLSPSTAAALPGTAIDRTRERRTLILLPLGEGHARQQAGRRHAEYLQHTLV